ncbi:protein GVQW3-like [Aphis craccivora]|uniref:Protein GVQW3-like n=1 Tax=Aphis craccivora TaxID=307492 RepID=A0A6G0YJX0_APHCR|nr:protein GVQW3-like [Aphis craccivora]
MYLYDEEPDASYSSNLITRTSSCIRTIIGLSCMTMLLIQLTHLTRFYTENQITVLSHPSYSPDLALGSGRLFFLFPKLKLKMKGHFFDDIQAIQRACIHQEA